MKLVRELINERMGQVFSVDPESTVLAALELMAEKNVGLLTVEKEGNLVGVVSERDYARKVILMGRSPRETAVAEIMTSKVLTVTPDQPLRECMSLMTSKGIRHLPVAGAGRVLGIISVGDVLQAVISEQEYAIQQLEKDLKNRIMLTPVQFENLKKIATQQGKNIGFLLREAVHRYLGDYDPRAKGR